jgi:SAM-dependent methyltransferase
MMNVSNLSANSDSGRDIRLFIISFVLLFVELMCIRWLSTEIRIFSYFQNFVLIACFFGFGIGVSFPRLNYPISVTILLMGAFAIFTSYLRLFESGSEILGLFHDYHIGQTIEKSIPVLEAVRHFLIVGLLFVLLVFTFIAIGVVLGKYLENHRRPIWAYSVNVAGSLLGIWVYTYVSYLGATPFVWFVISLALLLFFAYEERRGMFLPVLGAAIALVFVWPLNSPGKQVWWSPYQKLTLTPIYLDLDENNTVLPTSGRTGRQALYGYNLTANQAHIQFLENLSVYSKFYGRYNRYTIPFHFAGSIDDVLILGAGCGNDVAAALQLGAGHVDAVEIDPKIVDIGRQYHPNNPYRNDPRVNVVVNDARSFLKNTGRRYDLVNFSLLDAHTVGSGYTNIRLDDYVYTIESFKDARALLKPGGVISMRFWTEQPFTAERLYKNMTAAFGHPPYTFWQEGMFYLSGEPETIQKRFSDITDPEFRSVLADRRKAEEFLGRSDDTPPSTDDWPYLYLHTPRIPVSYLIITCILLASSILIVKTVLPVRPSFNAHFFFLGAGFLLIQVQNISKISLLFGNTWVVNSIIISIILIMILIANACIAYFNIRRTTPIYPFLFGLILLSYFLPLQVFMHFSPIVRGTLGGIVLCLPLLTAGLIFTVSFSKCRELNTAFGSNMIGTVLGGLFSSLSFIIGINALSLVGLVFYAVTFLTRDRLC